MEKAIAYARKATYTRCQYMGSKECLCNYNKATRGVCDFKSRLESFLAGCESTK